MKKSIITSSHLPPISIIVPTFNEENFIDDCIKSLLNGSYPKELIEILIIDGGSTDSTHEVIATLTNASDANIQLLHNPKKITPAAVNIGITNAQHNIVIWVGAHAIYDNDYLVSLVKTLIEKDYASVGGLLSPVGKTKTGEAIAVATTHKFGIGNAKYRYATTRQSVDTVFGGCWKKENITKIGGFNERWVRNQDYEFNCRLREHIGEIILEPKAKCYYFCRETITQLAKQYYQYGFWRHQTYLKHPNSFGLRQAMPVLLLLGLVCSAILAILDNKLSLLLPLVYLLSSLIVSLILSLKHKHFSYLILLPLIFATLHLVWAFGFIKGAIQHIFMQNSEHR